MDRSSRCFQTEITINLKKCIRWNGVTRQLGAKTFPNPIFYAISVVWNLRRVLQRVLTLLTDTKRLHPSADITSFFSIFSYAAGTNENSSHHVECTVENRRIVDVRKNERCRGGIVCYFESDTQAAGCRIIFGIYGPAHNVAKGWRLKKLLQEHISICSVIQWQTIFN